MAIGVVSSLVGVATILLLVAFGAIGDRSRATLPPPVVTTPNSPIDYALGQRVAENAAPVIVTVNSSQPGSGTQGSGVVLRTDRVVTSAHLVDEATSVKVSTKEGTTYDAKVIGSDPTTDVCLLEVDGVGEALPDPELTATAGIGDPVVPVAAGRATLGGSAWVWCRSGTGWPRTQRHRRRAGCSRRAPTPHRPRAAAGSSTRTVASSGSSPRRPAQPAGLAVTIEVVSTWPTNSSTRSRSPTAHSACSAPTQGGSGGALVSNVAEQGPAAKADPPLQTGDVIIRAGDTSIHGWLDLVAEARRRRPTDSLEVVFQRNGRTQRTVITLGSALPAVATEYGPLG
jgi:S1-C subfamily serine protease